MNFHHITRCSSGKETHHFQEFVNVSFDLHGGLSIDPNIEPISYDMLEDTSPKCSKKDQVIKEKYFGNLSINNFSS